MFLTLVITQSKKSSYLFSKIVNIKNNHQIYSFVMKYGFLKEITYITYAGKQLI
jgi:hypothetical protein